MKNITEAQRFPAGNLLSENLEPELIQELQRVADARKADNPEALAQVIAEVKEKLPAKVRKQLQQFGVDLPTDTVDLHLNTGLLLFELYSKNAIMPESPLAKRAAEKKLQELSEICLQEEFELPEWSKEPIKRALSTDSIWSTVALPVYTMVGDKKVYVPINSVGVGFYKEVLNQVVEAFE